jgi:hypothetical protein
MSGAIAMGASKITGLANGTASSDAAAFGQIPTALPPNGSAGGDLTGTYPNPTLAAAGTAGTYGSSSLIPVITTDSKGRVTGVTTSAPVDATKLPLAGGTLTGALNGTAATFTGELTGSDLVPSGLTGATTATRYVGGTVNSAPASGTFAKGDFVVDQSGTIWVCTTAGTPGTWTTTISSHLSLRTASATVTRNETTIFSGTTASQTLTAPSSPIDGSTWTVINKASVSVSLSFTPSMVPLGSGTGITTYTVSVGGSYSFVNYNGSQWYMVGTNDLDHMVDYSSVSLSKWGAAAANVAMGSNKITGLADGTASDDAAAFGQVSVKANSAITISTTAPLSGGGDLSANRTLTIADGTTSVKGAVQLTDSTSSTSTSTAATPNAVKTAYDLAAAALPKSGGTMSGAVAMGSNRITGLALPGASTDPLTASQGPALPSIGIHSNTASLKAWNADPAATPTYTGITYTTTSGVHQFTAISVPYAMTISQIWVWHTGGGTAGTSGAFYGFGIYSTTGTLLASTGNGVSSGFTGLTGALGWSLSASYTIQPGNYMIGFLWYAGTGGSPVAPIFGRTSNAVTAQINTNCPTPSSGKLDQRGCTAGTGQTSLYTSLSGITPTASNANFWVGLA